MGKETFTISICQEHFREFECTVAMDPGNSSLLPTSMCLCPFTRLLAHSLPCPSHFASLRLMLFFSSCSRKRVPSVSVSYIFPLSFLSSNMLKSLASFLPSTLLPFWTPFSQSPGSEPLQCNSSLLPGCYSDTTWWPSHLFLFSISTAATHVPTLL